jgi:hypothetical protein
MEIAELKRRLSLRDILTRDGVQIRRAGGSRFAALCPFHQEKTPSFYITASHTGDRFKCFGCDESGDVFDYWMRTRNVTLAEAKKALCASEGVAWTEARHRPLPPPPPAIVEPLSGAGLAVWEEGVAHLRNSEQDQCRIAKWRGFEPETIKDMADRGLMGLPIYRGSRNEAFAVEIPNTDPSGRFLAGYHVHTPKLKGRYRFEPQGIGSWPFVIGDIVHCHALVVLEGQWDAIAFYDAIAGYKVPIKGVAVVGIRGATAWRRILDYEWSPETQAFIFADGDDAGRQWQQEDSLSGALALRCRAIHMFCFELGDDGIKDFNDWMRRDWGITPEDLREFLRHHYKQGLKTRRRKWQKK